MNSINASRNLVCGCHDLCHQQSMFYVPCHRQILKWITYEFCVIQMRVLYGISKLLPHWVHLHIYFGLYNVFDKSQHLVMSFCGGITLQTSENDCLLNLVYESIKLCMYEASFFEHELFPH